MTENAQIYNHRLHDMFVSQRYIECIDLANTVLANGNLTFYPLLIKALCLKEQGNLTESLGLLQNAYKLNPHQPDIPNHIARVLYLIGRFEEAQSFLQVAARQGSAGWLSWHTRGLCLVELGRYGEAMECLLKANDISPNYQTKAEIARLHVKQGNLMEAIGTYNDVLSFAPMSGDILGVLGLLHLRLDSPDTAFECFARAVLADPSQTPSFFSLAATMQPRDPRAALQKYRVVNARSPGPEMWSNLGLAFMEMGREQEALASLRHAFSLRSSDPRIRHNLGYCLVKLGRDAAAFRVLSGCSEPIGDSHWLLAVAAARLGEYRFSLACYKRALEYKPSYSLAVAAAVTCLRFSDHAHAARFLAESDRMLCDDEPLPEAEACRGMLASLQADPALEGDVTAE
eukprot:gnl/Dysnectes_brevis/6463_a10044_418.p1 GENE.gnl/Dysnectes_brevis/6463_a10044_418~~gnl/Dysnectes_brevis/6463_a10044_418.p1  ORF type:complete len:401 (+),score=86.23 gnl/Dysnectes_brevis/6463_a10044_418:44-1246(+)